MFPEVDECELKRGVLDPSTCLQPPALREKLMMGKLVRASVSLQYKIGREIVIASTLWGCCECQ